MLLPRFELPSSWQEDYFALGPAPKSCPPIDGGYTVEDRRVFFLINHAAPTDLTQRSLITQPTPMEDT